MKKLFFTTAIIFFLIPAHYLMSENIRGNVINSVIFSDSDPKQEISFTMNIEDIFSVGIDEKAEFIRGFEVEVRIPTEMRRYGSSFALKIYKKITPAITAGIGTYYGTGYNIITLPDTTRFFIRIPFDEPLETENAPYTTVFRDALSDADLPLMFTVLPMMKGFPSSLYSSSFDITLRPIKKEFGILAINVTAPEGIDTENASIRIDGESRNYDKDGWQLSAGEHALNLEVSGGRSISKTFTIETGKTTTLDISIEKLESRVTIDAPESAGIYIDGEKYEGSPGSSIILSSGEHLILFKIDDYKISKKFTLQPGKDCKISLFLDIFIEEN